MARQHNAMMFLSLPKIILTIFGIWMLPYRNILYKIYTTCITALNIGFLAFNLIHMMLVWGDVDQMSEGSYLLFTHVATCSKSVNFVLRKDTFRRLLETMDAKVFKSQSKEHDAILYKHSKTVRKIYIAMAVSSLINCLQWTLTPLLDKTQKLYPFNVWMPGDVEMSPSYELGYAYQVVMVLNSAQIFLALDSVFTGVIMFTCAQLEMIMVNTKKIQNVPSTGLSANDKKELINHNKQQLSQCISHHQATNRFLKQVANMFNIPIFIQLTGSIMIVCVVGFRITVEPPNTPQFYSTLTYLVLMLAQLYLYCWCGNELTVRSEKLRDWMYFCPWYDNDKKFGDTLCFVMECMRRPVIFKAGYYISLSRPTFVSILRCSYSYFAVLNQKRKVE